MAAMTEPGSTSSGTPAMHERPGWPSIPARLAAIQRTRWPMLHWCETVTGKPYDQFAIESLFKPLGIEKWWFQFYDGGPGYGRHPSHGLGMPARELWIAYCTVHDGLWNGRQVIPRWFVEETAHPTHQVEGPEMRFKVNGANIFAWLGAAGALDGQGTAKRAGHPQRRPIQARPGGQLIAFVPSLDLVVTRQTGSSGAWQYEEFLRLACAAKVDDP